jgi:hypothetical protein
MKFTKEKLEKALTELLCRKKMSSFLHQKLDVRLKGITFAV